LANLSPAARSPTDADGDGAEHNDRLKLLRQEPCRRGQVGQQAAQDPISGDRHIAQFLALPVDLAGEAGDVGTPSRRRFVIRWPPGCFAHWAFLSRAVIPAFEKNS